MIAWFFSKRIRLTHGAGAFKRQILCLRVHTFDLAVPRKKFDGPFGLVFAALIVLGSLIRTGASVASWESKIWNSHTGL